MKQAIAELQRTAEIAEHNQPYSEAEGDTAQAELQRTTSQECREAIEQLKGDSPDL
ncbi:TPA: hypothetical protein ACUL4Z_000836 [Pseudomonas aeruginosa]|uniref:Uncharacterized protein n=1 Tax=Pseudomonas sihuiensis TaxID=1274359 RepID=A0A1H2LMG1_9PSED|nr:MULTISPECIES: hypothetical protein [Pseudomonas]ELJ2355599.1 hypothetical protein [Pseudomonas aeruginosa]EPL63731.1 hypothetical protein B382_04600 [Stutzerimonas stutzeri B1SMN1]SDU82109.1 hypothetical protein SAMN05216363_1870 [Pseudomonas sihuiensis]